MDELKPCPFCGEKAEIYLGDSSDGYIKGTQYIEAYCNKCGASIKARLVAEAIKKWNTRVEASGTTKPHVLCDFKAVDDTEVEASTDVEASNG